MNLFMVRLRITIINLTVSMREWVVVLVLRDLSLRKREVLLQIAILKTSMDSYRRVIPICALYVICPFILIRSGTIISMERLTADAVNCCLKYTQNGILTVTQDMGWVIPLCCSNPQTLHQEFWDHHPLPFTLEDLLLGQEELETETCKDRDTCRRAEWKQAELFTSWISRGERT